MGREVLDLNEFLERVQNDKELLLELLDIFVEDFQEKRKQMEAALKNNDCDQIKRLSHALKGSSGNISAKPLRSVLLQMEEKGKNGDLTGADGLLAEMDKEFEALAAHIATLKEELK